MTRFIVIALTMALAGCSPVWTRGKRLADAGRFEDATRYWLSALDEDLDAAAPRKGLERYGPDAVWVHLELAREHEAERRYEAALDEYGEALALADELAAVGVDANLDRQALGDEIEDVKDAWADYRFAQGERAAAEGAWLEAIDWWKKTLEVRPEYEGVPAVIADAYRTAGFAARDAREYARAIELLDEAVAWDDDPIALAWADALRTALGRWYLQQGACRAATALLTEVRTRSNDPRLDEAIQQAKDCARTELVVHTFERAAGDAFAGTDLASLATDALSERLRAHGSPFLFLVDPDQAPEVEISRGRRYEIRGRISQMTLDRTGPVAVEHPVTGTKKVECPSVDGYATYRPEMCDEDVHLTTTVTTSGVALALGGSVRATDAKSGEVAMTRTLEVRAAHESVHRGPFVDADGQPVEVGETPTEVVVAVDASVRELPTEPTPLPRDADLLAEAAGLLADAAATAILEAVDRQPPPPTPRRLEVVPPVTDPGQIEFATPDPVPDEPTRAVIPTP